MSTFLRRLLGALTAGFLYAGCGPSSTLPASSTLSSFGFSVSDNPSLRVDVPVVVSSSEVRVTVPWGSDLASLKPHFAATTGAAVTVGGVAQTSGVSAQDFRSPVTYMVGTGANATTYHVTLTDKLAAFDDGVEAMMSAYRIPGVGIAVTHGEKLIYERGYGLQDKEAGTAVERQSQFRLASVSKPITSVAILKLVEQGMLSLSDKVFGPGAVLGTEYGTLPYGSGITDITVAQLLHHTAGGWTNDGADPMFSNPGLTAGQLISWTLDHRPLTTPPGTAYAYSNFGYCILGRVIEHLTGKTYAEAVKSLVLEPMGITDMTLTGNTLAERLPHEVKYYGQDGDDPYVYNLRRMDSHGGWIASAGDLAKFLVHIDQFPKKADVLTASSIDAMTQGSSANASYGCGWSVNTANNWWHTGGLPGTGTEIIRGNNGWNFVVLANTRSHDSGFYRDMDGLLWNAISKLKLEPSYDLFTAP